MIYYLASWNYAMEQSDLSLHVTIEQAKQTCQNFVNDDPEYKFTRYSEEECRLNWQHELETNSGVTLAYAELGTSIFYITKCEVFNAPRSFKR